MNNLLKHWLIKYQNREEGFTFLEVLVAMTILMMALAFNGQMVLMLKMQNLKQEIESAAVAVGKNALDDLRFQLGKNITTIKETGNTPNEVTGVTSFGHSFDTDTYICTASPTIEPDSTDPNQLKVSDCPSNAPEAQIRYIVVQVKKNNEKIYTVQTNFAQLQR